LIYDEKFRNFGNIILNSQDILFIYGLQGELPSKYHPDGQPVREYLYHTENGTPELIAEM